MVGGNVDDLGCEGVIGVGLGATVPEIGGSVRLSLSSEGGSGDGERER